MSKSQDLNGLEWIFLHSYKHNSIKNTICEYNKYFSYVNVVPPDMSDTDRLEEAMKKGKEGQHFAHMAILSRKDIERALLECKKRELLNMYALDN